MTQLKKSSIWPDLNGFSLKFSMKFSTKNRLTYLEYCLFRHRKTNAHIYSEQIDIEVYISTFDVEKRREN